MKIGMIGLGRMGGNVEVVAYDLSFDVTEALAYRHDA